jgi:hypothetical protein
MTINDLLSDTSAFFQECLDKDHELAADLRAALMAGHHPYVVSELKGVGPVAWLAIGATNLKPEE